MGHFIVVNAGVNPRVPLSHALRGCFLGLWKTLNVGNSGLSYFCIRPNLENLVEFESFLAVFCPKSVSVLSHVPVSQEKNWLSKLPSLSGRGGRFLAGVGKADGHVWQKDAWSSSA